MKEYWAKKWSKYLQTPGLKQTKGRLSRGNKESSPKCCLGHAEYMVGNRFNADKDGYVDIVKKGKVIEHRCLVLSYNTKELFGMKTKEGDFDTPVVWRGNEFYDLSNLNDAGMPLKQIARVIFDRMDEL